MNSSNPPILPADENQPKPLSEPDGAMAKAKDSKSIMQAVWKLVKNKPASYQVRDEDLVKCGVHPTQCDRVREAVSRASSSGQNFVLGFFGWIFGQVGNFLDTIFKVALLIMVFLLSLQWPYLNEQANAKLRSLVSDGEFNYQKYDIAAKQLTENLALLGYKLDRSKLDKAIPQQMKEDRKKAARWLKYKGQTVEGIWASIPQDWSQTKPKLGALSEIYGETLKTYKPGLPMGKAPYLNAALVCLLVLSSYLILQSLLGLAFKNKLRQMALHRELKKALK